MNSTDIIQIKELIKMKKENPKEYKKLLEDMADVLYDIMKIASEIIKKIVDKLENDD